MQNNHCAQPFPNSTEEYPSSTQEVRQPNSEKIMDRETAIRKLAQLKNKLPEVTTLVDMKTNNVFAEPGTL